MTEAALFAAGRSQAVRAPGKHQFRSRQVYVRPTPDGLLLTERDPWDLGAERAAALSEDFMAARGQPPLGSRHLWPCQRRLSCSTPTR
jgi:virulence-associated protein VagC